MEIQKVIMQLAELIQDGKETVSVLLNGVEHKIVLIDKYADGKIKITIK
jgi:hypothetical protein